MMTRMMKWLISDDDIVESDHTVLDGCSQNFHNSYHPIFFSSVSLSYLHTYYRTVTDSEALVFHTGSC
jgi:hypothetical protein